MNVEVNSVRGSVMRIWKWRWLGWRDSTPGFKGSMILLGVVAAYIAVRAFTVW